MLVGLLRYGGRSLGTTLRWCSVAVSSLVVARSSSTRAAFSIQACSTMRSLRPSKPERLPCHGPVPLATK